MKLACTRHDPMTISHARTLISVYENNKGHPLVLEYAVAIHNLATALEAAGVPANIVEDIARGGPVA